MSYKIVDQIKKSSLPRTLKTVLEAYATFGNRDGTSIRPTEAAVARRASSSRSTVSRRTQTLVDVGLLVHDLDDKGFWLKYAYGENGVWAYVYHADVTKLRDPALVEKWETERKAFLEKCRQAGAKNFRTRWAKGTSGNISGVRNQLQQEQRVLRHGPKNKTLAPLTQVIILPLVAQRILKPKKKRKKEGRASLRSWHLMMKFVFLRLKPLRLFHLNQVTWWIHPWWKLRV